LLPWSLRTTLLFFNSLAGLGRDARAFFGNAIASFPVF
jgi:hypothetical protein